MSERTESDQRADPAPGQLPDGGKQPVQSRLIIAVVSLAILTFLGILSETSLNIAYSTLMQEFAIEASVVQWLTTGYLLLLSVAIPASPFMVRRFATKTLFIAAVLIFTAGTVLGAFATSFLLLLAARLVMALGTGISLPLITNIILEKAPLEQRGAMLGIVSLVTCAAPAIGPVFGGIVMEFLNWHWIFYTMLPFLVVSFLMGMATVPEIRHAGDREQASISVPSMILVALGLSGLIVAVSFFATWQGDWRFWTVLVASVVVLAGFVMVQLKMSEPLVQVRVFAYSGFSLGMLILLMASGSVLGLNFLLPIVLQRGFGMSSLAAALTLLPGAVVGAISAPLIGGSLKSHFPPKFIVIGFVAVTLMDALFIAVTGNIWVIAVAYAAFMAFSGFVLVPDQTHALNQLPGQLNADGSAVMNTVQQMAGAIGTAVASALVTEFAVAQSAAGESVADSYMHAFTQSMWVIGGMAVVGALLAALMFRYSTRRPPELTEVG